MGSSLPITATKAARPDRHPMKLHAYVLASDPGKLEASVLSYYDLVSRIVVSYDEEGRGWTGAPTPYAAECLRRLKAIDRDRKMVFSAGRYARVDHSPLDNDTYQRQAALDEASEGADGVVQIDTDEVIGSPKTFAECIAEAVRGGYTAMNYPATWLYSHAAGPWYLCRCLRGWRRLTDFPAPVVVRAGVKLTHCRQPGYGERFFHVDVSRKPNHLAWPPNVPVTRLIRREEGLFHFSWVRPRAWLEAKLASWSHSAGRDWSGDIRRWDRACKHPWLTCVESQFVKSSLYNWPLAPVKAPALVCELLEKCKASGDESKDEGEALAPAGSAPWVNGHSKGIQTTD